MNKITVKCTEIQWDDDIIADMLSDEYGFCLFGFNYEIINA